MPGHQCDTERQTSAKLVARALARLLPAAGVTDVVTSPGSRNAPLLQALDAGAAHGLRLWPVVDERSAAFMALGMAWASQRPVALCCTSGSALLNYLPAVAEAWSRRIPLVVISADRPARPFGQDDSQSIPQAGMLDRFAKAGADIADTDSPQRICSELSRVLQQCRQAPPGPVHINVRLDKPLHPLTSLDPTEFADEAEALSSAVAAGGNADVAPSHLAEELVRDCAGASRVLVALGFNCRGARVPHYIYSDIAAHADSSVAVYAEPLSGVRVAGVCCRAPQRLPEPPEVLITLGGSMVTPVKEWLRSNPPLKRWHLGSAADPCDYIDAPSQLVETTQPEALLTSVLAPLLERQGSGYSRQWQEPDVAPPASLTELLIDSLPSGINLQLGNGLTVRRAMTRRLRRFHSVGCNRGVSGIDGCTSTALGVALADECRPTVLVTGDMSAAYDLGALACRHVPSRLVIAVADNGGGHIFRGISSTGSLPVREPLICRRPALPLPHLAPAYGYDYLSIAGHSDMARAVDVITSSMSKPLILHLLEQQEV